MFVKRIAALSCLVEIGTQLVTLEDVHARALFCPWTCVVEQIR